MTIIIIIINLLLLDPALGCSCTLYQWATSSSSSSVSTTSAAAAMFWRQHYTAQWDEINTLHMSLVAADSWCCCCCCCCFDWCWKAGFVSPPGFNPGWKTPNHGSKGPPGRLLRSWPRLAILTTGWTYNATHDIKLNSRVSGEQTLVCALCMVCLPNTLQRGRRPREPASGRVARCNLPERYGLSVTASQFAICLSQTGWRARNSRIVHTVRVRKCRPVLATSLLGTGCLMQLK